MLCAGGGLGCRVIGGPSGRVLPAEMPSCGIAAITNAARSLLPDGHLLIRAADGWREFRTWLSLRRYCGFSLA